MVLPTELILYIGEFTNPETFINIYLSCKLTYNYFPHNYKSKVLENMLINNPEESLKNSNIPYIIKSVNRNRIFYTTIKYLNKEFILSADTFKTCIYHGFSLLLIWLCQQRPNKYSIMEIVSNSAAFKGDLCILNWIWKKRFLISTRTFDIAFQNKQYHVISWLKNRWKENISQFQFYFYQDFPVF